MLTGAVVVTLAYLLGSVSTAIVVCRLMGLPDPRTEGSNNPGATNVLRIGGKKAAALTLAGDSLKGVIPMLACHLLGVSVTVFALAGLAVFLGHLYPVFFGFKGGKGVATFLGALLALDLGAGLVACAAWLAVALVLRYSSLSSLCAAAVAPFALFGLTGAVDLSLVIAAMSVLLIVRHRQNIANLLAGRERRIGEKSART